jgi:hypothetical protein
MPRALAAYLWLELCIASNLNIKNSIGISQPYLFLALKI